MKNIVNKIIADFFDMANSFNSVFLAGTIAIIVVICIIVFILHKLDK